MSTATYRVAEKKCATCRWWQGSRTIEFRILSPNYVKADAKPAPCMALKGESKTPATFCSRWSKWEKL